jgi:hypothetical protein
MDEDYIAKGRKEEGETAGCRASSFIEPAEC